MHCLALLWLHLSLLYRPLSLCLPLLHYPSSLELLSLLRLPLLHQPLALELLSLLRLPLLHQPLLLQSLFLLRLFPPQHIFPLDLRRPSASLLRLLVLTRRLLPLLRLRLFFAVRERPMLDLRLSILTRRHVRDHMSIRLSGPFGTPNRQAGRLPLFPSRTLL